MAPRIHKGDLEALRELLAKEYDSEDEYLKGLWEAVCGLLSQRDAFGVRIDTGDVKTAYGPFYDRREAMKVAGAYGGAVSGTFAFVAHLDAPDRLRLKTPDVKKYEKKCASCGHLKLLHQWPGKGGGCIQGWKFVGAQKKPDMKGICGCKDD